MSKLNFQAVNDALDADTVLPQWLPGGQKRGPEWVSANPTRKDSNAGSFTVNMVKGVWKDFASGDGGSDLVSLYAYLFCGNDQGAAVKELAENQGIKLGDLPAPIPGGKVKQIDEAAPKPVIPVPAGVPACTSFKHPTHGDASKVWAYLDAAGALMFYICRFDPEDGSRKQISPRSWCDHPGKASRWTWRGITGKAKRPLYGLDTLAAMPDADVILVEGEKSKDAGQELMQGAAVVVSWMGGVETADRADLTPLADRRVILFPDFDALRDKAGEMLPMWEQPGMRAMMTHAMALKGIAREVVMVGYDINEAGHGWDLADAQESGWDGAKVLKYIGMYSGDPALISMGRPKAPPADADADEPAPPRVPLECEVNIFGFPHRSAKDAPVNSVENMDYLLGEYGITAKYNQIRKSVEVVIPSRSYTVDNRSNCSLAELSSLCSRNRMPESKMGEYVKLIADRNAYNPVTDWFRSKPWDGVSRIQDLLDTVSTSGEVWLKDALMRRWLISAVAAAAQPNGFEGHGCLVFAGPQGSGKTTWFRRLVPAAMNLVAVGAMLDPADKDSVTNVVSHWIVELGELDATFRKADIARLKSFIPKAVDKLRRPYDRIDSEYQRRTVFGASVNDERYLVDDTGNRRWWTVSVSAINYRHDIDMQQLWAEVLVLFDAGEQYHLTPEENAALGHLNEEHEAIDPVEELILSKFNWEKRDAFGQEMTASQVLLAIGFDKPNKAQATHVSKVLKKITGGDPKKKNSGRYFQMPPLVRGKQVTPDEDTRPW